MGIAWIYVSFLALAPQSTCVLALSHRASDTFDWCDNRRLLAHICCFHSHIAPGFASFRFVHTMP